MVRTVPHAAHTYCSGLGLGSAFDISWWPCSFIPFRTPQFVQSRDEACKRLSDTVRNTLDHEAVRNLWGFSRVIYTGVPASIGAQTFSEFPVRESARCPRGSRSRSLCSPA